MDSTNIAVANFFFVSLCLLALLVTVMRSSVQSLRIGSLQQSKMRVVPEMELARPL